MDQSLLDLLLIALTCVALANLVLTLRLVSVVRVNTDNPPFHVEIAASLPGFHGKAWYDGRLVSSAKMYGQAAVLVFLSAGCEKCLGRIPELKRLNLLMIQSDIPLWIIAVDSSRRIARHVEKYGLARNVLELAPYTRRSLNPNATSPFYVFIDHEGAVQARNIIGDENWKAFVEQINDRHSNPALEL